MWREKRLLIWGNSASDPPGGFSLMTLFVLLEAAVQSYALLRVQEVMGNQFISELLIYVIYTKACVQYNKRLFLHVTVCLDDGVKHCTHRTKKVGPNSGCSV